MRRHSSQIPDRGVAFGLALSRLGLSPLITNGKWKSFSERRLYVHNVTQGRTAIYMAHEIMTPEPSTESVDG